MAKHQVLVGVVLAAPVALLTSAWIAGCRMYGPRRGDERRGAPVHLCLLGVLPVGHHRASVPRRLCRQFARLLIRRELPAKEMTRAGPAATTLGRRNARAVDACVDRPWTTLLELLAASSWLLLLLWPTT
ncbi:hypothetical protein PVAP13_5NG012301 [Panicum virgatum]|uniref:Uncharacterized protein n=1 Tax=Panicum virgatum TaxID=38727 RepID=A0A8T0S4F6_PANVG|nr:hypothetical protein PVAP13_5NG012301 [Panicum virgatum]